MQNESSNRSALEARLHAQLHLQAEAMVAMEMKLMRLEAGMQQQGHHHHHHHQRGELPRGGGGGGSGLAGGGGGSAGGGGRGGGMGGAHRSTGGNSLLPPVGVLRGPSAGSLNIVSGLPPISSEAPFYEEDEEGDGSSLRGEGGVPRAVRATRGPISSGASYASAVTDGFTVEEDASTKNGDDDDDDSIGHTAGGTAGASVDGSASTPTFGGGRQQRNLEQILMDPEIRGVVNVERVSTRATRGAPDDESHGASTLATNMTHLTGATHPSTVISGSTREGESIIQVRALTPAPGLGGNVVDTSALRLSASPPAEERSQRSQSPITIDDASRAETASVGPLSTMSQTPSIAASQLSTAVIPPPRSRTYRTRQAARLGGMMNSDRPEGRVVQFTSNAAPIVISDGAGDSVTVPDELDNLSDVAEAFARSANQWREEYESRLDAIQKKYSDGGGGNE